jgi:hypothetical protein
MTDFERYIQLREEQETKPTPKSNAFVVIETDSKLTEYQPFKKQLKPDVKYLIYYDYELKRWVLKETII